MAAAEAVVVGKERSPRSRARSKRCRRKLEFRFHRLLRGRNLLINLPMKISTKMLFVSVTDLLGKENLKRSITTKEMFVLPVL